MHRVVRRAGPCVRYAIAAVGLAAVAFAARHLDGRAVLQALRSIDPVLGIAAALVMIGAKLGAKVGCAQTVLVEHCAQLGVAAPSWRQTAHVLVASHAAGHLAWGPLGITVRTLALRDFGIPLGVVARVQVAERVAEALGMAAIALATLAVDPRAILGSWFGRVLIGVLAVIAAAGAVTARRWLEPATAVAAPTEVVQVAAPAR